MKYGLNLNLLAGFTPTASDVIRLAQEAETLGYHSILAADHVLMPTHFDASAYPAGVFERRTPYYDPFVFLAGIASVTRTIRLGTGISVIPYRPPIQQAQAIATLDFMSEGRCFVGAGIGWMREEFDALGVPFSERGERTDEYIRVMKLIWSGSGEAFHGKFVDFDGGRINPLPIQKPHPPIFIGGETPPALRRIASYGDGFHIAWKSLPDFKKIIDELASNMASRGRQLSDLYKRLGATKVELVRAQKERLPEYEALGLDEIVFSPGCNSADEGLDKIRRVADEFF